MNSDFERPKLFFKFKSLASGNSLSRLDDILTNNRLFFPDRRKLNDPFEGLVCKLNASGYAGTTIAAAIDSEGTALGPRRDEFRILALSSDCFSPLMWTHYGDECKGICLCFRSDASFSISLPVKYVQDYDVTTETLESTQSLDEKLLNSFLYKHIDWQYEKEWRAVTKTEGNYFSYLADELVAVIFGHRIDDGNKRIIKRVLSSSVKQYYTYIGGQSGQLHLLREGYSIPGDGSAPEFISSLEDLYLDVFGDYCVKVH